MIRKLFEGIMERGMIIFVGLVVIIIGLFSPRKSAKMLNEVFKRINTLEGFNCSFSKGDRK